MPKLKITRGVSGSGKSTWARSQFGALVVARDDLRLAHFGSDRDDYYKVSKDVLRQREDFITKVEHAAIEAGLRAGMDVISDNTNIHHKYVNQIVKIARKVGAEVEVKEFHVPLDEALRRNKARGASGGRFVPEKTIREQHQSFQGSKGFTVQPVVPVKPYTGTPGKPKAVLVDIDGTIAHMKDYRKPFDWKSVGKDEPDLNVMQVITWIRMGMHASVYPFGAYDQQAKVILMSGRDRVCEQETRDWLTSWDFNFDALFMRPEGDMRADNIVKAELFDQHIRDNYDVVMVFDDRNQVVDMWRAMGVQVAQVAEGDF